MDPSTRSPREAQLNRRWSATALNKAKFATIFFSRCLIEISNISTVKYIDRYRALPPEPLTPSDVFDVEFHNG
jgi:hypothetical protein